MGFKVWKILDVAQAAGIEVSTLRSWVHRDYVRLCERDSNAGPTSAHYLDWHGALAVKLAACLMQLGVSAAEAFKYVYDFVHVGDADRDPGEVFNSLPGADTVLLLSAGALPQVKSIDFKTGLFEAVADLGGMNAPTIVFPLGRVCQFFREALDARPAAMMS